MTQRLPWLLVAMMFVSACQNEEALRPAAPRTLVAASAPSTIPAPPTDVAPTAEGPASAPAMAIEAGAAVKATDFGAPLVSKKKIRLPKWATASPHYEERKGKKVAVAIGVAPGRNLALGRNAAANRARARIVRFLAGAPIDANDWSEAQLEGSEITNVYSGRDGNIYVEVAKTVEKTVP